MKRYQFCIKRNLQSSLPLTDIKKKNSPEYLKVVKPNLQLNLDIKNNVSCKTGLRVKYKVAKS